MTLPAENVDRLVACDKTLSDGEAASIITAMCDQWSTALRHLSIKGVDGAPDWMGFERKIWELGESLRKCFIKRRDWRESTSLLEVIRSVARDPRFAKGRQSFVVLLGHFGGSGAASTLRELLNDKEVQGHALMALRLGKITDAVSEAREIAGKSTGWVRSEAKKYLRAAEGSSGNSDR